MIRHLLEICVDSSGGCLAAAGGGADRIELCSALDTGGITPSYGFIREARKICDTKRMALHVLIRPRGGGFVYSNEEFETMISDIEACQALGVDGIVTGCLTPDGSIDTGSMSRLMDASGLTPVTFHRAFDLCSDPVKALEDIIGLGCKRILTSGCEISAENGIPRLAELISQAAGRIEIMPGGGVTQNNIAAIAQSTGARELHSSARTQKPQSRLYPNKKVTFSDTLSATDAGRVGAMRKALDRISN